MTLHVTKHNNKKHRFVSYWEPLNMVVSAHMHSHDRRQQCAFYMYRSGTRCFVYICTKIACQMDADGLSKVFDAAETASSAIEEAWRNLP